MTSTETRDSWSERLSPRNWSLAWKLVAVGLVPAVLAIVLGVLRVTDQAQTASQLGAANRLLEVRQQVADTATALRAERDHATVFVAERRLGDRAPLQESIDKTDAAVKQAVDGIAGTGDVDTTARFAIEQAQGGFASLSGLRSNVTGTAALPPAQVLQRYNDVVGRTDVLDRTLLRQLRTPAVAGLADGMTAVTQASEALALQHTVLGAALRVGTVSADDRATINAADNTFVDAYNVYRVSLPPSQTPVNFVTSAANAQRDSDKSTILSAPAPGPISVTVAQWDDVSQRAAERVDAASSELRTALSDASTGAETRSSNLAGINSVLLMLGLLLAATIVALVTRGLTRSLRVLRTSALDVAQRRLPQAVESMRSGGAPDVTVEPVPLHNRDEVGQVARAFDAVHGQALRLAADQAALQSNVSSMFVNLSRRSQALVERQLQLIEQLESNEQDPDQLSNLFQLDHLATRMRRNSENLLVLAGTDVAKRNGAPVPLVDVLRAAVSEIEQYQRIVVQAPPQATLVGRSTSDIVHLLAELLDNATNFSPPDSQVVMSSMSMPDGSIMVEIADRGVGMVDQEIDDANRRLNTPSAVDVSASRRMGLFVVGRLGARHGIPVHLGGAPNGSPGGGVTASVTLPGHLVVSSGDANGRQRRSDAPAPAAGPNGLAPHRAGSSVRPTPRAAPPAPEAPQPRSKPAAVNGLPTRTPGSSLPRVLASDGAPVPFGAPVHSPTPLGSAAETASDRTPGRLEDERRTATQRSDSASGAVEPDRDGELEADGARADAGDAASESDDAPTAALPVTPAAAEGVPVDDMERSAGEPSDDDRADVAPADAGRAAAVWEEPGRSAARARAGDEQSSSEQVAGERTAGDDAARNRADDGLVDDGALAANGHGGPAGRSASPRPRPSPARGPNGTYRDHAVPEAPYEARAGAGQNGAAEYAAAEHGPGENGPGENGPGENGTAENGFAPLTTPLPVVAGPPGPEESGPDDDAGEELFAASVPAITEPEGLPRSRRPLGGLRRGGPVDMAETTPIFEEIASAWFASHRPVPVAWEFGEPSIAESAPDPVPDAPAAVTDAPAPVTDAPAPVTDAPAPVTDAPAAVTDAPAAAIPDAPAAVQAVQAAPAEPVDGAGEPAERPADAPTPDQPSEAFASAADEGWRAASGAAAERPDELTAAGLPKRRPRARLVPGSAGSAVLAAAVPSARSAESVRGRLASYQQGVRQGREIRLRREPGGAGPEPAPTGDNTVASTGGEHDEESR